MRPLEARKVSIGAGTGAAARAADDHGGGLWSSDRGSNRCNSAVGLQASRLDAAWGAQAEPSECTVRVESGAPVDLRESRARAVSGRTTACGAALDRRAPDVAESAKYAAIPRFRLQDAGTSGAFIEILARIGRHGLGLGRATVRARQCTLQTDRRFVIHGRSRQLCGASCCMCSWS